MPDHKHYNSPPGTAASGRTRLVSGTRMVVEPVAAPDERPAPPLPPRPGALKQGLCPTCGIRIRRKRDGALIVGLCCGIRYRLGRGGDWEVEG